MKLLQAMHKPLGQLLVEASLIDEQQLRSALAEQRRRGHPLGRTLVEMGLVSEEMMVRALAHQLNVPMVELEHVALDDAALALLDAEFCRRNACVPFRYHEQGQVLEVAMADPTDQAVHDQIRVRTRCTVRAHLAGPLAIEDALRRYLGEARCSSPSLGAWRAEEAAGLAVPRRPRPITGPMMPAPRRTPPVTGPFPAVRPVHALEQELGQLREDLTALHSLVDQDAAEHRQAFDEQQRAASKAADEMRRELRLLTSRQLALTEQLEELQAMIERDEKVLRRLMGLLLDKSLFTRDELMARIGEE